jgi:hypothetical protein
MAKKRRREKATRSVETPSPAKSELLRALASHRQLRNQQRNALSSFSPLVEAFDEVLARLALLESTHGLHKEMGHLLHMAGSTVTAGIDHLLSVAEPHDVEEARMLMEIDFLLRDFGAIPAHIDEWATADDRNRQSKFGFGKLREREERRAGLPPESVFPEREQWAAHSVHSHPLPTKDLEPPLQHPSFSLLSALGDLFDHAFTVEDSGRKAVLAQTGSLPPGYEKMPRAAGVDFRTHLAEVLESHIAPGDLAELYSVRRKKSTPRKYWQGGSPGS